MKRIHTFGTHNRPPIDHDTPFNGPIESPVYLYSLTSRFPSPYGPHEKRYFTFGWIDDLANIETVNTQETSLSGQHTPESGIQILMMDGDGRTSIKMYLKQNLDEGDVSKGGEACGRFFGEL